MSCADAKRLVGMRFSDSFVKKYIFHWPFEIVPEDDKAMIAVNYMGEMKKLYPEEISAMVITRMKDTAAAMTYGLKHKFISVKNVLVVDLGGGTLDVSLVSMDVNSFTVKSTYGNQHLGGQDFTNTMVNHLIKELRNKNIKCDLNVSLKVIRRVKTVCEEAKIILSTAEKAEIHLDTLCNGICES
ncbi:putative Heat shock protein 70 family [Medicago truncatula]|uniref:Heat shock cognate 70 kDa protein n=1 Tax=Medicago truncatula TaxID=3880 RepID=G7K2A6_MEDTR|nr:putative heat shock 70 kDa protein 7 [Medicago truncatula]AES93640.1 heat shock cognate 70 kDa protein [Medicago truncatula]RHN53285.1 putative Heat shock protein 70 family [Medicago truncatula]